MVTAHTGIIRLLLQSVGEDLKAIFSGVLRLASYIFPLYERPQWGLDKSSCFFLGSIYFSNHKRHKTSAY